MPTPSDPTSAPSKQFSSDVNGDLVWADSVEEWINERMTETFSDPASQGKNYLEIMQSLDQERVINANT